MDAALRVPSVWDPGTRLLKAVRLGTVTREPKSRRVVVPPWGRYAAISTACRGVRPSPDRSCAVPSQRETARQQASKDGAMEGLAVRDDSEWHESKDRAGSTGSRVPGSIF